MITVNDFFDLLMKELEKNPDLRTYYRFLNNPHSSVFNFRKRYFCQRLEYINSSVSKTGAEIWDCGCGYGTTAIFLVLNGHKVFGNTLEFYFKQIPSRIDYWSKFGDLSNLSLTHENLFDISPIKKYDYIIVQDTLHHLEPICEALKILSGSLAAEGKLIAIEENGKSLINRFKNFIRRGNKLIIDIHDEKTNRKVLLGNENLRTLKQLEKLMQENNNMKIDGSSVEFIRLYIPFFYKMIPLFKIDIKEQLIWRKNSFLRDYFYFGLNFTAKNFNN
jgi:SAM-dependent methyltransferase